MAGQVERFIRIQAPAHGAGAKAWHTLPNCEKLAVWEYLALIAPNELTGADEKRMVFHIRFVDGVRKGARVTFLGNHFIVLTVSDSTRLVGLELNCIPAEVSP